MCLMSFVVCTYMLWLLLCWCFVYVYNTILYKHLVRVDVLFVAVFEWLFVFFCFVGCLCCMFCLLIAVWVSGCSFVFIMLVSFCVYCLRMCFMGCVASVAHCCFGVCVSSYIFIIVIIVIGFVLFGLCCCYMNTWILCVIVFVLFARCLLMCGSVVCCCCFVLVLMFVVVLYDVWSCFVLMSVYINITALSCVIIVIRAVMICVW